MVVFDPQVHALMPVVLHHTCVHSYVYMCTHQQLRLPTLPQQARMKKRRSGETRGGSVNETAESLLGLLGIPQYRTLLVWLRLLWPGAVPQAVWGNQVRAKGVESSLKVH